MRIRLKVCCISSVDEARVAVQAGADLLGLVSEMPSGPGVITESTIADIAMTIPPGVARVLLTALLDADAIVDQARRCRVDSVQIVDRVPPGVRRAIREKAPGLRILQVVHVTGAESLDEAREAAEFADALLLDSGNPGAAIPELGGTGRRHDWDVSRRIVAGAPVPVFLAGGINPGNVREAIRVAQPFGIDLCSGVRHEGALDPARLGALVRAMRGSD